MQKIRNGIPADRLPGVVWMKSRRSNPEGNCVEMASLPGQAVAVRNSRDPKGPALVYTRTEIAGFVIAAKAGDFDQFLR